MFFSLWLVINLVFCKGDGVRVTPIFTNTFHEIHDIIMRLRKYFDRLEALFESELDVTIKR